MARKQNWYTSLPVVLFGIRLLPSEGGFPPFTAVTGTNMLCPAPMISGTTIVTTDASLRSLVRDMQSIDFSSSASGSCHSLPQPYVPDDLSVCSNVWLRVDRIRKSLEAPYSGPYRVLSRAPKFFTIQLPRGPSTVSIDRLKPAYISPPTTTTSPEDTPVVPPLPSTSSDSTPSLTPLLHSTPSQPTAPPTLHGRDTDTAPSLKTR